MSPQQNHEARIKALEELLCGNPGAPARSDVVSLKEHIDSRIAAQQEYFTTRIGNLESNVGVATTAMDKRLDSMNELRGAMKDQQAQTPSRDEVNAQIKAIRDEMSLQFKGLREEIGLQLAPLKQTVEDAKKFMAVAQGKADQSAVYIGYFFTGISIILAVISMFK